MKKKLKIQITEAAFLLLVVGEVIEIPIDGEDAVAELLLDDIGFDRIVRHITFAATDPEKRSPIKP